MTIKKLIGTLCVLGFFAMPAFAAETQRAGGPGGGPCKQDVQSLCPAVKPGEGRIAACLKANHEKVSAGCKAAIKARHGQHKGESGAK